MKRLASVLPLAPIALLLLAYGPAIKPLGPVTIGDGVTSHGTFDATEFAGTADLFHAALEAGAGAVAVLPGTYAAPTVPVRLSGGSSVVGIGRVIVESGNAPAFAVSGPDVVLSGVTIRATSRGAGPMVTASVFQRVRLEAVRFLPAEGRTCVVASAGRALDVLDCYAGPEDLSAGAGQAYAYRVLDLFDVESGRIAGNVVLNLGDADRPVDAVVHADTSDHEGHHVRIEGNTVERIIRGAAGRVLRLVGGRFVTVTGNGIGRCPGDLPAIFLGPGGGHPGGPVVVTGNEIHNCGAPVVEVTSSKGAVVVGNGFGLLPPGTPAGGSVSVDATSVGAVVADNSEGP
ncbi:MAG: hypothetical protein ACF8XB_01145 [Planctomycetota bacterium JB042]